MWKSWAHNNWLKNMVLIFKHIFYFLFVRCYLGMCNKRALTAVPSAWLQKWLQMLHTLIVIWDFTGHNHHSLSTRVLLRFCLCAFNVQPFILLLLSLTCGLFVKATVCRKTQAGSAWVKRQGSHLPHKHPLQNFPTTIETELYNTCG